MLVDLSYALVKHEGSSISCVETIASIIISRQNSPSLGVYDHTIQVR